MKISYVGPPALNRDIGRETDHGDALNPGDVIEVSNALAKRLLASSVHFEAVTQGEN